MSEIEKNTPNVLTSPVFSAFKIGNHQLLQGDCLEEMKKIKGGSVDLILCDLPYGTTQNKWDSILPLDLIWKEYWRILKKNGAIVLFGAQPFTSKLILSQEKQFRYSLVWEKNKASGFLNANRMPLRIHEDILVFYKKLPTYHPQKTTGHKPSNRYTKHTSDGSNYGKTKQGLKGGGQTERFPTSILKFPVMNNDDPLKFHPTQKPIPLYEYLIRTFSNEGDTVLDNCMGSGTILHACQNTNRKAIGIEQNPFYFKKAFDWFTQSQAQSQNNIRKEREEIK